MNTVTEVKERPILFSTPMVKAILEGRKTVTRRVVTARNSSFSGTFGGWPSLDFSQAYVDGDKSQYQYLHVPNPAWETSHRVGPKYDKGDILWVRETWAPFNGDCGIGCEYGCHCPTYIYKADYDDTEVIWKPSIHMPRAACRLRLEIVSIGVERLQDITEEDAIREGIEPDPLGPDSIDGGVLYPGLRFYNYADVGYRYVKPLESFQSLWTKINGPESWNANPWVWRIEFKVIE